MDIRYVINAMTIVLREYRIYILVARVYYVHVDTRHAISSECYLYGASQRGGQPNKEVWAVK